MRTGCFLLLLLGLFSSVSADGAEVRTWTDRNGRRADAEFIRFSDGKVEVKRTADGRLFQVAIESLCDADQSFVQSKTRTEQLPSAESQEVDDGQIPIPQEIAVADVLKLLKGLKSLGQACGAATWKAEPCGYHVDFYSSVTVPWSKTPQKVDVGFVSGGQPLQHHLIEFSGANFRFRRNGDAPTLTRIKIGDK